MKTELHDRINCVINTPAFEETLKAEGICLFDFQAEWSGFASFENLPSAFQKAILAGEAELSTATVALA
jgi:hypothetical protein